MPFFHFIIKKMNQKLGGFFLDNSSTKKLSSSQKSSRNSSGIFMESNRNSDRNQSDGEDGDVVLDVFSVPEQDRAK